MEVLEGEIVAEDEALVDCRGQDRASDRGSRSRCRRGDLSLKRRSSTNCRPSWLKSGLRPAAQTDKSQRIAAEFQNSKKRQERQLSDAIQRASGHLVEQLLPILDDFDLAFGNLPEDLGEEDSSWVEGFRQIHKKLASVLEDQGVTPIALDGEFDPNLHEAISSEPSEDVESGHIIETLRVGYEFKGRVLRPAMVRVAS